MIARHLRYFGVRDVISFLLYLFLEYFDLLLKHICIFIWRNSVFLLQFLNFVFSEFHFHLVSGDLAVESFDGLAKVADFLFILCNLAFVELLLAG